MTAFKNNKPGSRQLYNSMG